MLLNGLWMVCNDPSAETTATPDSAQLEKSAECIRICAMKHALDLGKICFVLPDDSKTSIAILDFGVALLPLEFRLQPFALEEPLVTKVSAVYVNPTLSNRTPPPKA